MKTGGKFFAFFDRLLGYLAAISFALLLLIMISVGVSVILRYLFSYSILWLQEVIEAAIVWICFLVSAWVLKRNKHVRMDLFIHQLNPKSQALVDAINSILCAIMCSILFWYGTKVTVYYFEKGLYRPGVLSFPFGVLTIVIPAGSVLLCIEFVRRTRHYLEEWRTSEKQ